MTDKTKIKYDIGIDDRVSNLENCDKKLLFTEFRNKKLTDKEKFVYSMIIFLSKENECTISSAYIGNL